jgi:hypothetical protein
MTTAPQRLTRAEIEELVDDLRSRDNDPWAEGERYPVVLEVTNRHLVWVEAESPEDAVKILQNDGEWYERIGSDNPAFDYRAETHTADPWEYSRDKIGPLRLCGSCGGRQPEMALGISHKPDCPTRTAT